MKFHYTYILECIDKTYYCGYTTDLATRVSDHNFSSQGAKYTKGRRPVKLVYFEKFDSKSQALKREFKIKKMSRLQKLHLVKMFKSTALNSSYDLTSINF